MIRPAYLRSHLIDERLMRAKGFSVLELLLVLIVITGILLIGLRRYWIYHERVNLYGISSDETRIMLALNRYFQSVGCTREGYFHSTHLEPALSDLGDPELKTGMGRAAVVEKYRVQIKDSGQRAGIKPIYELRVIADMDKKLEMKKVQGLANLFNARVENQELVWTNLPGEGLAEKGNPVWILQASATQFRSRQNSLPSSLDVSLPEISPSYCIGG